MTYPREVLNRLRWTDEGLAGVKVTYIHRGSPSGELTIDASAIKKMSRSFFSTEESTVPYHRIVRITRGGLKLFDIKDYGERNPTGGGEKV